MFSLSRYKPLQYTNISFQRAVQSGGIPLEETFAVTFPAFRDDKSFCYSLVLDEPNVCVYEALEAYSCKQTRSEERKKQLRLGNKFCKAFLFCLMQARIHLNIHFGSFPYSTFKFGRKKLAVVLGGYWFFSCIY